MATAPPQEPQFPFMKEELIYKQAPQNSKAPPYLSTFVLPNQIKSMLLINFVSVYNILYV